ncbi:LOW QUALITY PROTEIN: hypothetical protein PanWU01x14_245860, partial [Parasponia andersonii]
NTKNLFSSKTRPLSSPSPLNFSSTKLDEKHVVVLKSDLASTYYQVSKDFIQDRCKKQT